MKDRGIALDRSSQVTLQRQLEDGLRSAILTGRLRAGERILSSRELQTHFGVSRNTVVNALAQLHAEGFLHTVRGVGTFVARALHERARPSQPREPEFAVVPSPAAARDAAARAAAENLRANLPFRPGIPALDRFPSAHFRRALASRAWNADALDYPEAAGDAQLREAICSRIRQTRGVACTPDRVFITGGAQAAFALIARVLVRPRDRVVVEDPGYPNARAVLEAAGARLGFARVDGEGIDVSTIAARDVRLAMTTPSHQYPTGAVLSLPRRFALLEWALRRNAWIVEDDYDSEFNYTGNPQPALYSLDDAARVLYVGTFSKVLSPALRIAYVVVPRVLREPFAAAHTVTGAQPSTLLQQTLAGFMASGRFGRHVAAMRRLYDERRRHTAAELVHRLGDATAIRDTRTGLHFVAILPPGLDAAAVSRRAERHGVIAPPLSSFHREHPPDNGLVIGYAGWSMPAASAAAVKLAEAAGFPR